MENCSVKKPSVRWKKSVATCGLCFVLVANFVDNRRGETKDFADKALETQDDSFGEPFPVKLEQSLPGLQHVLQASRTVFSGGEPHGEKAFTSLKELGVKTIVSVDGLRPDVETAKKYGIKYVHIPIGYDEVSEKACLSLLAVARADSGPVYVHCHHGQHRGPAAAAILCMAEGGTDKQQAKRILEMAKTSKEYAGLWRDVANYRLPALNVTLPTLVEAAEVESLAKSMAQVDRQWDILKLCKEANWQTPNAHPDRSPARAALLVKEGLHEANRTLQQNHDEQFKKWLADAEATAEQIETDLKAGRHTRLDQQMTKLEQSCKTCHVKYRN